MLLIFNVANQVFVAISDDDIQYVVNSELLEKAIQKQVQESLASDENINMMVLRMMSLRLEEIQDAKTENDNNFVSYGVFMSVIIVFVLLIGAIGALLFTLLKKVQRTNEIIRKKEAEMRQNQNSNNAGIKRSEPIDLHPRSSNNDVMRIQKLEKRVESLEHRENMTGEKVASVQKQTEFSEPKIEKKESIPRKERKLVEQIYANIKNGVFSRAEIERKAYFMLYVYDDDYTEFDLSDLGKDASAIKYLTSYQTILPSCFDAVSGSVLDIKRISCSRGEANKVGDEQWRVSKKGQIRYE